MFTEQYMRCALAAAAILGPLCALLGVFVTARRLSFFSDTIAHGALAGVAIGIWLGIADLTLPMVIFSLAVAGAMVWLKENTDLLNDSIMALLLSGSVAIGILILSLAQTNRGELHGYLFGDVLAVEWRDVGMAAVLAAFVAGGLFTQLTPLTLLTANEELANVSGVHVRRLNYAFIVVLTVTVALSIRLLGVVLVTSLLVIPPAIARPLSVNLRQQLVLSVIAGLVGSIGGTMLAWRLNAPCGPTIVLSCIALFILSLVGGKVIRRNPNLI
jgi:hypothetical protein